MTRLSGRAPYTRSCPARASRSEVFWLNLAVAVFLRQLLRSQHSFLSFSCKIVEIHFDHLSKIF